MTSTCTRTSTEVAEWAKIFPVSAAQNYTHSILFMKQLTTIAVSTITYTQKIFPEENYKAEKLAGVQLKILKKQCSDPAATSLADAVIRTFDAFNKKYLEKLVLHFYAKERNIDNLIETIEFEYSYDESGGMMNIRSKNQADLMTGRTVDTKENVIEAVRKQTIKLLETCILKAAEVKDIGSSVKIIDVQIYYNEDTPRDYQVAGFESADQDEDHLAMSRLDMFRVHEVTTPYHGVVTNIYYAAAENIARRSTPIVSCHLPLRSEDTDSSDSTPLVWGNESQSTVVLSREMEVDELDPSIPSDGTSGRAKLDCFCNKYKEEDLINTALIQCQYCGRQQHSVCYGVLQHHAPLIQHCCLECFAADTSRNVTDHLLTRVDGTTRQKLVNYRRLLAYCSRTAVVSTQRLQRALSCSANSARMLMQKLHLHGIIPADPDDSSPQDINLDILNNLISKYFNMTGTILTQDSNDLPDSMEGLSTSISNSQVSRGPGSSQADPDPVLQEYRDALSANDTVDEPETSIAESIKKSVKRSSDECNIKRGKTKLIKKTA